MVNCTLNFEKHSFVISGCSELFAKIWGSENGVGIGSVAGVGSLPNNIPVQIEAVFELFADEDEVVITESVTEIEIEKDA